MIAPVAAVVVAYRSASVIDACLRSLAGKAAQIVVVDNAAEPALPEIAAQAAPRVKCIVNPENRGFAAAVNQGVAATDAPYVLLLNPDCELLTGLEALVDCCRRKNAAAAGGLLLDADGAPQIGFFARSLPTPAALAFEVLGVNRLWPRNPVNRRYRLLDIDPQIEQEVGQPAGAFLLVRRSAFEAVGGMDERFHPLWFEDVDLCLRLRRAGGAVCCTPKAAARHVGAHSVETLPMRMRRRFWYGSLLEFAEKHYSTATYRCLRLAAALGFALRRFCFGFGSSLPSRPAARAKMFRRSRNRCPNDASGIRGENTEISTLS